MNLGSREIVFRGVEFAPGLIIPTRFCLSHLIRITTGVGWPPADFHSPCHVPVNGCPSWAHPATALTSSAKPKAPQAFPRILPSARAVINMNRASYRVTFRLREVKDPGGRSVPPANLGP